MNTIENVKKKDEFVRIDKIRIDKEKVFIISTSRVSLQFEHVEMKIVIRENTSVVSDIERAMHRADFVSGRKRSRDKKRDIERKSKRSSNRERRERDRKQTTMTKKV